MSEPFDGFSIGQKYRLHEDMWTASPGFGTYIGGITPKGRYPNTEAIIVLAEIEGGRYGNRWDGDVLVYQGEDDKWAPNPKTADQRINRGNNKTLRNHNENGAPVYLFTKTEKELLWNYQGLAGVQSIVLTRRSRRNVVEFRLQLVGFGSRRSLANAERNLLDIERADPPALTNGSSSISNRLQRLRSDTFRRRVKGNYLFRCAVCGSSRRDAWGRPEVEACHIYPKEEDGSDDPRNGLALCSFHHWAFDGGLLLVLEDLTLRLSEAGRSVPELRRLEGKPLSVLPREASGRPHPIYLRARLGLERFSSLA